MSVRSQVKLVLHECVRRYLSALDDLEDLNSVDDILPAFESFVADLDIKDVADSVEVEMDLDDSENHSDDDED